MSALSSRFRTAARAAFVASAGLVCCAGHAAIVSGTLSFTASGLPMDPIVGTVSFSFDNSAGFFNAADGATVNGAPVEVRLGGLSLPGAWTPVLTYVKNGVIAGQPVQDLMSIGHLLNGTQTLAGSDDWRIAFNSISTGPAFREFTYTLASAPGAVFQTFVGSVSVVPEPASAAMAALGLAWLLVARRRGSASARPRLLPRAL